MRIKTEGVERERLATAVGEEEKQGKEGFQNFDEDFEPFGSHS
jgi:hypothetical protein